MVLLVSKPKKLKPRKPSHVDLHFQRIKHYLIILFATYSAYLWTYCLIISTTNIQIIT